MGYCESWGLLYHEYPIKKFLLSERIYKKNGNKGGHNKTLWTTLSFCTGMETKNISFGSFGKPLLLDVDVRICLGD